VESTRAESAKYNRCLEIEQIMVRGEQGERSQHKWPFPHQQRSKSAKCHQRPRGRKCGSIGLSERVGGLSSYEHEMRKVESVELKPWVLHEVTDR
jgi:hypothetical protein